MQLGSSNRTRAIHLCSGSQIYKQTSDGQYTNQVSPFDKKTYGELLTLGFDTCDFSVAGTTPVIISISTTSFIPNQNKVITVTGGGFTNFTTVSANGFTINSVTYVDANTLTVDMTAGPTAIVSDFEATNGGGVGALLNGISIVIFNGVDLRSGNTFTVGTGNPNGTEDILLRTGMTMQQDANGMSFTGSNPWSSWALFNMEGFTRASNSTVKWMFTSPTAAMMIGIGSGAINPTANDQYRQNETLAYFQNSNTNWGLYGNNGTVGGTGNQANSQSMTGTHYRVEITNSGSVGGTYSFYQVPDGSLSSFYDTSNLLITYTIGGTLNPDEINLMPCIIPRSASTQRFIFLEVS